MQDAIDAAVKAAQEAYDAANKNPLDHGYAHIEGVDGRTRLASALQAHPRTGVSTGGVGGTSVAIDGINRYLGPQTSAYRAFIDTLQEHDIDGADTLSIFQHGH